MGQLDKGDTSMHKEDIWRKTSPGGQWGPSNENPNIISGTTEIFSSQL